MLIDDVKRMKKKNGGNLDGDTTRWLHAMKSASKEFEHATVNISRIKQKVEHDTAILNGEWKQTAEDDFPQTYLESKREAQMILEDLVLLERFTLALYDLFQII